MRPGNDTVDLREVGAALRHGIGWIVGGAVLGVLLALAVNLLAPPVYEATASILLRSSTEGVASRLAGGSSDEGGVSLGGLVDVLSGGSGFDTEMEILTSQAVLGEVVDSLNLQARILEPRGRSAVSLFSAAHLEGAESEVYHFAREGDGFRVSSGDDAMRAVSGVPFRIGGALLTLRRDDLPRAFEVEVIDREQAVQELEDQLQAEKAGGDIAELVFNAHDPATAAAVPNALIAEYLARRRTTDRGVNQFQYEFLAAHTDSIADALADAERRLRLYQEQSGILDPELSGETETEQAARLRARMEEVGVEARALEQTLGRGTPSARALAASPTLLGNPAVNNVLARLVEAETRRTELLERRTARDPDVLVLDTTIQQLEGELITLSRAYLEGLSRQQAEIQQELSGYRASLDALPAQAEQTYRLQREVERLAATLTALKTQLVQTRLAAIGEVGQVRQIDVAVPPREPDFPKPVLNLAGGLLGGLFFGAVVAVGRGLLRQRIRYPWEVEMATGIPATSLESRTPLLFKGLDEVHGVLVIPLGPKARSALVASRLAETVALRGRSVVLADLRHISAASEPVGKRADLLPATSGEIDPSSLHLDTGSAGGNGYPVYRISENGNAGATPPAVLHALQKRFGLAVVALAGPDEPSTVALLDPNRTVVLVVRAGRVLRSEVEDAVELFARVGVQVAGIVLDEGNGTRPTRRSGAPAQPSE